MRIQFGGTASFTLKERLCEGAGLCVCYAPKQALEGRYGFDWWDCFAAFQDSTNLMVRFQRLAVTFDRVGLPFRQTTNGERPTANDRVFICVHPSNLFHLRFHPKEPGESLCDPCVLLCVFVVPLPIFLPVLKKMKKNPPKPAFSRFVERIF